MSGGTSSAQPLSTFGHRPGLTSSTRRSSRSRQGTCSEDGDSSLRSEEEEDGGKGGEGDGSSDGGDGSSDEGAGSEVGGA